jgi:hypothetical protein
VAKKVGFLLGKNMEKCWDIFQMFSQKTEFYRLLKITTQKSGNTWDDLTIQHTQ